MPHQYQPALVALSLAVAILASYTMLDVGLRVRAVGQRAFRFWLVGGSLAMGLGIWSMHFIGMLAHRMHGPVGYDPALTALSVLPAVGAAALALWLLRQRLPARQAVGMGGAVIGAGIATMHYTGMAALRTSMSLRYDPAWVAASCVIAVGAAWVALWVATRLQVDDRRLPAKKLLGALVLGLAITGMHYTGMAAARFTHATGDAVGPGAMGEPALAIAVGLGGLSVLAVTLLIAVFDGRHAAEHAAARLRLEAEVERRRAREDELQHMAMHDPLTGLPNRAFFMDQLERALRAACRRGDVLAVLAIDLDGFKGVNDRFGHATGDGLLRDIARRLRTAVPAEDMVARLGGDEFVVLLADAGSPEAIARQARALLDALAVPGTGETSLAAAASIGVAMHPQDGDTVDGLLRAADFALYHAKGTGKGGYHFFDGQLQSRVREQERRLRELKHALLGDELELHYQPQVAVDDGRIVGVEALLRWRHPVEGLLGPAVFLPVAEQAGLMPVLDAWVLRRACRDAAAWRRDGQPLDVAVNVSAQSVAPPYVDMVEAALAESGLPPAALELELTETTLLNAGDTGVVDVLQRLAALGVRLSIDDFGTGYGSLLYLRTLPITGLKIDRHFVQAAPATPKDAAIVRSLVDLARTLELSVVAEGVESIAQLGLLQAVACPVAQGFLYSAAVPAAQVARHAGRRAVLGVPA